MARYFIEVAYDGRRYGGFQIQKNAITIQSEVTEALQTFYKQAFELTGSSRTDAGVHARQNFFHFNAGVALRDPASNVYNLNAILPPDIVVRRLFRVADDAHCRFDALAREYRYYVYGFKNPFVRDTAYYFPYRLDVGRMNAAAALLCQTADFTSFSKRNTQVKNFICTIDTSAWYREHDLLIYHVRSNRFLRGMVKALVGTLLRVGQGKISLEDFAAIVAAQDCRRADFTPPSHGLFLERVHFPAGFDGCVS